MTNFPLPPGAVEAAAKAYHDHGGAQNDASMPSALQAFLQWCCENGVAETCENFVWSDDEQHKFGNYEKEDGSDDMPPVLILKLEEPKP